MEATMEESPMENGEDLDIVLVKIGGSSITVKEQRETLNEKALDWFISVLRDNIDPIFVCAGEGARGTKGANRTGRQRRSGFIVVHGAGSFGHFEAKKYGLRGQTGEPSFKRHKSYNCTERRTRMHGLARTRCSVQKLNQMVVNSLVDEGVNAVGISPCFGIPKLQAHAGNQPESFGNLCTVVKDTVAAGLVPCIHGDAGLFGDDASILSGDTIVELLGKQQWIDRVVFITDVDGVFTEDPRANPKAKLLRNIIVEKETGRILTEVKATSSSHEHDVTGGLETKLQSATSIAKSGRDVFIIKCESSSFEKVLENTVSSGLVGTTVSCR